MRSSPSLTIPWGQAVDASGAGGGGNGYHFVWARDEYQQVTGLLAAGDTAAAQGAVTWLFTRQQLPDGHFPQNSQADGTPDQTNIQLDETAYPLILAWQIGRSTGLLPDHIARAADYLVANGPTTPQERWEETGGYSPSTIADMIAGLTAAAEIATRAGDKRRRRDLPGHRRLVATQIEKWTYTTTGNLSDGNYYVRISGNGEPERRRHPQLGQRRRRAQGERRRDAGFLELTRLGVKAPTDPYVAHSLAAVDQSLRSPPPAVRCGKRYTFDGYGEKADGAPWTGVGIGRPWPLLSGERGEYVLGQRRRRAAVPAHHGQLRQRRVHDPRAGLGPGRPDRLQPRLRQGHRIGGPAGVGDGPVRAAGPGHRRRQGRRDPTVVADRYAGQAPPAARADVTSPTDLSTATSRTVTSPAPPPRRRCTCRSTASSRQVA